MTAGPSIVDLFKNSKPRSKLFIQMIPPGLSEDDFKELIKEYLSEIDYMVFRPGKIIRDPYGHLIGLDCPNYGFATINFKNSRSCPKFHREFHQFQLSDNYSKNKKLAMYIGKILSFPFALDIKSKLFIEFALMQQVPETLGVSESKEKFRDLAIFKEFLKTFPFAAKAEEDRLASIGPVAIDLEDETIAADSQQVPVTKTSELEAKLSVSITPTSPLPQVTFSSLLAKNNSELKSSAEAVTPLTEYIKTLSLSEKLLPPADKEKEKKERELKEKAKRDAKLKKKEKDARRKEQKDAAKKAKAEKAAKAAAAKSDKADKNAAVKSDKPFNTSNQSPQTEKKTFKTKTTTATSATESLVGKQAQAPQIKGVPKILARKPANELKETSPVPAPVVPVVESEKTSARQPYIPPTAPQAPSNYSSKNLTVPDIIEHVNHIKTSTSSVKKKDSNSHGNSHVPRTPYVPSKASEDPPVNPNDGRNFETASVLDSLGKLLNGDESKYYPAEPPKLPNNSDRVISIPKRNLPTEVKSPNSEVRAISIPKRKLTTNTAKSHESVVGSLSNLLGGETLRTLYAPPAETKPAVPISTSSITNSESDKPEPEQKSINNPTNNNSDKSVIERVTDSPSQPEVPHVPMPAIKPEPVTKTQSSGSSKSSKPVAQNKSSNESAKKKDNPAVGNSSSDSKVQSPNGNEQDIKIEELFKKLMATDSYSSNNSEPSTKQKSNAKPANQPKKQPKAKTLAERSGKASSPREVYIRPELPSHIPIEPAVEVNATKAQDKESAPKKIVVKTNKSKPTSPKSAPTEAPAQPAAAVNPVPVKKVFTSSAKQRESKQTQ